MQTNAIDITVLICTYNRSHYLVRALESMVTQTLDPSRFEVIVVDNNSSDRTREVVEEAITAHVGINIRYVLETKQGLSVARNRGANEAQGAFLAYLDDDARAEPQWLSSVVEAFQTLEPAPACIGGRVHLDWEGERPKWFPPQFLSLYTELDHGDQILLLNNQPQNRYLQGANMAFQRHLIVSDGYAFPENIGRKGTNLISGEETEIISRLMMDDHPVYYVPSSAVWHVVLPERRTRKHFYRRLIANGATQPLMDINQGALDRSRLRKRALYDLKQCVLLFLKMLIHYLLFQRDRAEQSLFDALRHYGRFTMEVRLLRRFECAE